MPRGDRAFHAVTERSPCPICGSGGWCRVSVDGSVVLCRRVEEGGRAKLDAAGTPYYVHRLAPGSAPVHDAPDLAVEPSRDLAAVEVRAEVYAALMGWRGTC